MRETGARERERCIHVRINRKLRRVSTPAELFIVDSTYARIFPYHAARESDYKTLHFRPSTGLPFGVRSVARCYAEDINKGIYGRPVRVKLQ